MAALNERWHKPTRSGVNGNCVEARFIADVVEVRNSNCPEAGTVRFTRDEWETFIAAVDIDGEFRLP
jgi:Domain of unknown function (DUF397)